MKKIMSIVAVLAAAAAPTAAWAHGSGSECTAGCCQEGESCGEHGGQCEAGCDCPCCANDE